MRPRSRRVHVRLGDTAALRRLGLRPSARRHNPTRGRTADPHSTPIASAIFAQSRLSTAAASLPSLRMTIKKMRSNAARLKPCPCYKACESAGARSERRNRRSPWAGLGLAFDIALRARLWMKLVVGTGGSSGRNPAPTTANLSLFTSTVRHLSRLPAIQSIWETVSLALIPEPLERA